MPTNIHARNEIEAALRFFAAKTCDAHPCILESAVNAISAGSESLHSVVATLSGLESTLVQREFLALQAQIVEQQQASIELAQKQVDDQHRIANHVAGEEEKTPALAVIKPLRKPTKEE